MTSDKDQALALMQQAADEAAMTLRKAEQELRDEREGPSWSEASALRIADAIATLTAQLAAAEAKGVAAGLEMAAKVAEDRVAGIYRSDSNYHKGAIGEAKYMAGHIRALADQYKPSPAEDDKEPTK